MLVNARRGTWLKNSIRVYHNGGYATELAYSQPNEGFGAKLQNGVKDFAAVTQLDQSDLDGCKFQCIVTGRP